MNVEDALIGKMLGLRYQIMEKIGSGGMAVVYKAKCHMLNRFVAVKVLKPELKNDIEIVAKFKAESQAAASLSHHNIVSVYDVGEEDGISYIVMEYVEGITLKEYIEKKGMIPWREACGIAMQICDAIEQAHRNNIIHNDIKPHNILLADNNTVKVADFGIARAMSGVSADTMVVSRSAIGSVYYMSPEQDKGRFTDARSDIYSIGIVFYEMLAGRVPFDGDNHVMISLKKIEEDPVDVRIYNPDIPERISVIVLKAISKESHARYQTAEDMCRELTRATSKNYDFYDAAGIDNNDLSNTRKVKTIDDAVNIRRELLKGTGREEVQGDTDEKHAVRSGRMSAVAAVITTVIIIAVAFGTYVFMTGGKKELTTPTLTGLTLEEAQARIKDKDFTIAEPVLTKSSSEAETGKILLQDPGANAPAKAGTKITVTIGSGPELTEGSVEVPELEKHSYTDAVRLLSERGLRASKTDEESESVNEGFVIRQSPEKGTMVAENSVVMLYVSVGENKKVRVPSVEGMTLEKAEEELKTYGFNVGSVERRESSAAEGIVIGQSPEEGTQAARKSTVDIVVSGNTQSTQRPAATGAVVYKPKIDTGNAGNAGSAGNAGNSDNTNNTNAETQKPAAATQAPVKTPEPQSDPDNAQKPKPGNTNENAGKEEKTKTLTVSFNDTVGETVRVRIEANGREIHNAVHKKSEGGTQIPVKGTKDAEVKIYFDDQLVATKTISFD